jgi:Cellulose binding domain
MTSRKAFLWVAVSLPTVLAMLGIGCKSAEVEVDAAMKPDRPVTSVTGGKGGSSMGGDGGQAAGGQAGGGGAGQGGSAGGAAGAAGSSGAGGAAGSAGRTGKDASAGGSKDASTSAGKDAASGGTAGDGGVSCNDTTSYGRLGVYYYSDSTASSQSITIHLDVVNFTALSAKLTQVTVRYWFTDEDPTSPNVMEQYYVPINTTMKFVPVNPPRQGADTVLEMSYPMNPDAGTSFVETRGFNFAFHKNNYASNYNQSNDYSYDPKLTSSLGQNPKITAYVNGDLAWGCEPPAGTAAPVDGGTTTPAVDAGADRYRSTDVGRAGGIDGGAISGT